MESDGLILQQQMGQMQEDCRWSKGLSGVTVRQWIVGLVFVIIALLLLLNTQNTCTLQDSHTFI